MPSQRISRKDFLTTLMCSTWTVVLLVALLARSQTHTAAEEGLKRFLQDYTSVPHSPQDKSTRYFEAFIDLNNDKQDEVIVYLMGPKWCGSGGCTVLILLSKGPTFQVLTRITVVRRPVRVLAATSNGWHNLGVWVQGGGVLAGYEAILKFDGKGYPSNPTLPPAQRSQRKEKGNVVMSDELKELKALYP
jgi:hypothetical protein